MTTITRTSLAAVLVVAVGGGGAAYFKHGEASALPTVSHMTVTRGDVVEAVTSTGTLQPLRTVNIGTQVSGIVQKLYVDFNSIVKQGQVIAELDPSIMKEQVDLSAAAVEQAKGVLAGEENTLEVDRTNADRAETLFSAGLDTAEDRDAAELVRKQDEATVLEDRAAVTVAEGNLEQAKVNLAYCTITSPVDGVVIERDVDEGQAVAARVAAPTLYILATDLTSLELMGNVDEADVAKIRPGQDVTFQVDSFPGSTFHGTVVSVRLNAMTTSNVVTYQTVISVPNPDLRLKPSMTANIRLETGRASGALRVPNLALKFHPTGQMFAAFHEPLPPTVSIAAGGPCGGIPCAPSSLPPASHAGVASGRADETIDKDFPLAPPAVFSGQVWVRDHQQLTRVPVRTGLSDGTWTEVVGGDIAEGREVVTGVALPNAPTGRGAAANPLIGQGAGRGR